MVMHARKHPRLNVNDGYYERDYHEDKADRFQVRSNNDRKPLNDRYSREEYERQDSPRFSHKLPYIDRIRPDKDRSKYNREQDGFAKEDVRFNDKRRTSITTDSNRLVENSNDSNVDKRRTKDVKDFSSKPEDGKIILTTTVVAEKRHNSSQAKDSRIEAQKTALRVCGDWSEHVSSSGKKYFYNCKTEVSQWVKPKEWKAADEQARQESGKVITASKSSEVLPQNGTTCLQSNNIKPDSKPSHHSGSAERIQKAESDKRSSVGERTAGSPGAHSNRHRQIASNNYSNHQRQRNHEQSSSAASSPSSSLVDTASPNTNSSRDKNSCVRRQAQVVRQQPRPSRETNGGGSGDDMDISPDGSPKPAVESSCYTQGGDRISGARVKAVEPQGSELRGPRGAVQNNESDQSMIWGKALETLQTLQEVLERSRGAGNPSATNSSHTIDSPVSTTSQSPRVIPLSAQSERIVENKISSESLEKSPTPSEASLGQNSVLSTATSSDSTLVPSSAPVTLPQSLINYYDPSLIGHISDWPAEQIELRAHMAYKDGLIICGHHCGQVSTELKRDRSQVRIAEVQSTLIEHRIMFLKRQISELETQDRNFSSGQT